MWVSIFTWVSLKSSRWYPFPKALNNLKIHLTLGIKLPEAISKSTAKLLKDLTGEPRLDSAVRKAVKDSLIHRLEKIDPEIEEFKEKYGMEFEEFQDAWEDDEIEDRYSYDVESDLWRWEELVTRKKKIEEALEWLG